MEYKKVENDSEYLAWLLEGEVDAMIDYEQGNLTEEETIRLFQNLVNSGLVWSLQGNYGRTAKRLLEGGLICGPAE